MARKPKINEYFVPKDGLSREVITADICRYLGNDASVRPGTYEAMIADIKGDSERWQAEQAAGLRVNHGTRGDPEYRLSQVHASRQYYGPTEQIYTSSPFDPSHDSYYIAPQGSPSQDSYYIAGGDLAAASSPQIVKHLRPNRKCLPIFLNDHSFEGCADYGSEGNVITQELADNLGLTTIPNNKNCPVFRLPNGKLLYPYGWTMITCRFPKEDEPAGDFPFFVFSDFIVPLILGRRFLRTTETLTKHFHRLKDLSPTIDAMPKVCYLGDDLEGGQEQISFWLDGKKLGSTPDTGSQLNLMSLKFALQHGYKIDPFNCQLMQFVDGTIVESRGCIDVHISFGGDGSGSRAPVTVLDLVDTFTNDCQSPRSGGNVYYGPQTAIMARFHVLDCLKNVDLILGVDILATVDAFVQYNRHFRFTPAKGMYDLFWIDILSGVAKVWADSRFSGASRRTVDSMTQLLEEMYDLRALDENLINNPPANWHTGQRRDEQAAEDQRLHDSYQLRLDQIANEIMAEHARVTTAVGTASTNQINDTVPRRRWFRR